MDVTVSVAGDDSGAETAGEQTRALYNWLTQEAELRGRVRLAEPEPVAGTLGLASSELLISLGPGGALTVLAGSVIAWIRHRTSEVSCTLTRPDGTSVEVTGKRVREVDTRELSEFVAQLTLSLDSAEAGDGNAGRGDPSAE